MQNQPGDLSLNTRTQCLLVSPPSLDAAARHTAHSCGASAGEQGQAAVAGDSLLVCCEVWLDLWREEGREGREGG